MFESTFHIEIPLQIEKIFTKQAGSTVHLSDSVKQKLTGDVTFRKYVGTLQQINYPNGPICKKHFTYSDSALFGVTSFIYLQQCEL